jgi:hypothetical protein
MIRMATTWFLTTMAAQISLWPSDAGLGIEPTGAKKVLRWRYAG